MIGLSTVIPLSWRILQNHVIKEPADDTQPTPIENEKTENGGLRVQMLDYRKMLKDELAQRQRRREKYSLTQFAAQMQLSTSFVSRVLAGKKNLSAESGVQIAKSLGWDDRKAARFVSLVSVEHLQESNQSADIIAQTDILSIPAYEGMSVDILHAISKWHHAAIIELVSLETFENSPAWIAKRLAISVIEATLALDRLKRLGLLREMNGKLATGAPSYSSGDIPAQAIREFHSQMLAKADKALSSQNHDERDITGTTVAIDPEMIGDAKEIIKKFRRTLVAKLNSGKKKQVYHLAVQFFRLDTGDRC